MSLLGRTVARVVPLAMETLPKFTTSKASLIPRQSISRYYNCLSSASTTFIQAQTPCSCGYLGARHAHTKGDKELSDFLVTEIESEKQSMAKTIPKTLGDFAVKPDRAQLVLSRKFHDEEIIISLDVNHTVDAEAAPGELSADGQEAEFKSKPSFEIDIKKGSRVMSFTCSYITPEDNPEIPVQEQAAEDVFGINELTVYEGEWSEEVYCVSGDIIDAGMYDLLLNYLEERGISEEFVENLSNLCSDYEHVLYVGLLEKVKDFVK